MTQSLQHFSFAKLQVFKSSTTFYLASQSFKSHFNLFRCQARFFCVRRSQVNLHIISYSWDPPISITISTYLSGHVGHDISLAQPFLSCALNSRRDIADTKVLTYLAWVHHVVKVIQRRSGYLRKVHSLKLDEVKRSRGSTGRTHCL